MRPILQRLREVLYIAWAAPAFAILAGSSERAKIEHDVRRWIECLEAGPQSDLRRQHAWLMARLPEFRSLFWFRVRQDNLVAVLIGKRIHRPPRTPEINVRDLGGGLFIQHGFASIIVAERIGEDCWVNQQVTVGHVGHRGAPTIGDRVIIASGSVVVGPIRVGNDVSIGANTTVTKDLPDGVTVVGPSFRILDRE